MLRNMLSYYIGIDERTVDSLLSLSKREIFTDSTYTRLLDELDKHYLQETMGAAREAYELGLENLKQHLAGQFNLNVEPMSAFTLGNWVAGYLFYQDTLPDLLQLHRAVPTDAIAVGLPDILEMLEQIPQAGAEWTKAMSLLALPLLLER